MKNNLKIYNTFTRKKEQFIPINHPFVGIYLCGPTVYGSPHLGHARSAIVFDIIFRYLKYLNYKVRYIKNITDVGHLERDLDNGRDKVLLQANIEKLEPMEITQYYTNIYDRNMSLLNIIPPSIEPRASGNILEQIELIKKIIFSGFGYISNGSVYFNLEKYKKKKIYGNLSGIIIDNLLKKNKNLSKKIEKKFIFDFALWKKAGKSHIMNWNSPWGRGFPGWHLECSAMSNKYLGKKFDIHGGGIDLLFPHHECEIAQSQVLNNINPAKYWMHNNLITINKKKMGKSLGNIITLDNIFYGNHFLFNKPYGLMVIKFFILQSHYRNPLDFSLLALNASQKGYLKLINGLKVIKKLKYKKSDNINIDNNIVNKINFFCQECYKSIDNDFNTAKLISNLFKLLKYINDINCKILDFSKIKKKTFLNLKNTYKIFIEDNLGLREESAFLKKKNLIKILIKIYKKAKKKKDYNTVDFIRLQLKLNGIILQDYFNINWSYKT